MVYWQINMAKYDGLRIDKKYENLRIVWSQIFKYLFMFDHIQKYLVYRYLDSTSWISDKLVFGPIKLFKLFGLNFNE